MKKKKSPPQPVVGNLKDGNPKDLVGLTKVPLHLWPMTATVMGAMGLLDGALKYGRTNWRVKGVKASIYYDAAMRHLSRWFEGEEIDPDSGLPHMCHLLATVAIIVDAQAAGLLNDDRMVAGGYIELLKQMSPHVKRLQELHKDKSPYHYTISDPQMAQDRLEHDPDNYDVVENVSMWAPGKVFKDRGAR